jgi:hypothetical protein
MVAVIVSLAMIGGLGELAEAAVHLVETGHVDHPSALHTDGEVPSSPEHGCSGTFHLCGCCARPAFAQSPPMVVPQRAEAISPRTGEHLDPVTEPHVRGLLRPPRAPRV